MDFYEILDKLNNVDIKGDSQAYARCPAHNDQHNSLSIGVGDNKRILLHCHAGCTTDSILSAMGLTTKDLFPNQSPLQKSKKKRVCSYDYTDEFGTFLNQKTRWIDEAGNKAFSWSHKENGKWKKGRNGRKVLYNLPAVIKADTVYLVEGEKDVETLKSNGLTATTAPDGAGNKKWLTDYDRYLSGKSVIVIPDNDEIGRNFAEKVARSVARVATVTLLDLREEWPNLREHGDITDLIEQYGAETVLKKLSSLIQNTPVYNAGGQVLERSDIVERLRELKPEFNYKQSDIDTAKLFADIIRKFARYNTTAKEWYIYDGHIWKKDSGGMNIARIAKTFAVALLAYNSEIKDDDIRGQYGKYVSQYNKYNNRETLIKDARSELFISTEDFDQDGNLFNCLNGTYHLDTGEFTEHNPEDLISKVSNVIYDPNAVSTDFESFISTIMKDDQEKIAYLQKTLGLALTTDTSNETCWIWYGPTTRNGKGTLAETISYMMGNSSGYAFAMSPETLAQKKNKDTRTASGDIARLQGCRFLNASEPPKRMLFDAALLKTFLGRDTIVARNLFEREFEFIPQFKLFINTNHLPQIQDQSLFTSGRINVVLFERHFEPYEQDHKLKDRLRKPKNISGVFNWCLEGLKLYREVGIDPPESVVSATNEYKKSSDKIQMFMDEQMKKESGKNESAGEAYNRYAEWCEDNGFRTESKRSFFDDLQSKGIFADKGTVSGKTVKNIIKGYRFQTEADRDVESDRVKSEVMTAADLPF